MSDFWQSSSCSRRCGSIEASRGRGDVEEAEEAEEEEALPPPTAPAPTPTPPLSPPPRHASSTPPASLANDTTLTNPLSIAANLLASAGSCLTMSPPEKTASMELHIAWTASHRSSVSATAESLPCQGPTSRSLKGRACLLEASEPSVTRASSRASSSSAVSEGLRTMAPRSLWSAKDRRAAAQVAARARSLSSTACSFRALAATSSMARRCVGRSAARRWPTRRRVGGGEDEDDEEEAEEDGGEEEDETPSSSSSPSAKGIGGSGSSPCCDSSRALTSAQCLSRIALWASSASRGTRSATRSTAARQAAYAGHSLSVFGRESAAAWKPATRSAISAVASQTSTTAADEEEEEEEAAAAEELPPPPPPPRC